MDLRCVEEFDTLKQARQFIQTITYNANVKITREWDCYNNKYVYIVWYDAPSIF